MTNLIFKGLTCEWDHAKVQEAMSHHPALAEHTDESTSFIAVRSHLGGHVLLQCVIEEDGLEAHLFISGLVSPKQIGVIPELARFFGVKRVIVVSPRDVVDSLCIRFGFKCVGGREYILELP